MKIMLSGKNFEEELKKVIFDRIYEIQDKNQEIIANTRTMGKSLGIDLEMSNIARTATNKLITDIVPQFKNAGLKFYSDSIVSRAVYLQIIEYVVQGHNVLKKCNDSLTLKKNGKTEQSQEDRTDERGVTLKPSNAISRFFANFRRSFQSPRKKKNAINPDDIAMAKSHMDEYENLDKQLWKYNLRDNIIPALTEVICPDNNFIYLATTVPELVYEDIAPELTKLGLGDLVPKLEEELIAKYTRYEEGRLENCTSQEEIDMYIPNFEKYRAEHQIEKDSHKQQNQPETKVQGNGQNETLKISGTIEADGVEPGED